MKPISISRPSSVEEANVTRWAIVISAAFLMIVSGTTFIGLAAATPQASGYHLVKKVILGGEDTWDYLGVDPDTHRIFLPRHTHTMVLDLDGKVIGDIPKTGWAHAIDFAPELKRGFISNGIAASMTVFDLGTLEIIRTVPIPNRNPDDLIYDPASRRVFTLNNTPESVVVAPGSESSAAGGDDVTAIDAMTGRIVGYLPFDGKLEGGQTDGRGRMYVEIEPKNEVAVFDSKKLTILARWPTAPCEQPGGQQAIDVAHHRLFVGCRNKMMAVMNTDTGKVVATFPIGQGEDATKFDPGTGLAFASCGDGTITVAHEDSPDKFTVMQTIATDKGARTMTVDTKNHNVYTLAAKLGPVPPKTPETPSPRPKALPDTVTLWIFSR